MIEISKHMAAEIQNVIGDLRRMAWDKKGNRAANMRRRAKLIESYIIKKEKDGKKERYNR